MELHRRHFLASASAALLLPPFHARADEPAASPTPGQFSFDTVQALAKARAAKPYQPPTNELPPAIRALDYAHFRMINYKAARAFWRDSGLFQVQLFHRGYQFDHKVAINLVDKGIVAALDYSPDMFDFGGNQLDPPTDPDFGFSGFRLHFPMNRPDYFDEFAVFQGASYFRLIGRGQQYGLSARGLAIDTASPQGEEFPIFTDFWIERPTPAATWVTVYALLDSKSTAGAFRFTILPGTVTRTRVEVQLFPRLDIRKPGLAPLTSMFMQGKLGNRPFATLEPETHDSDGLMAHTGAGEFIWRPLVNPHALRISAFSDASPKGFGLMQRERDFDDYQDPDLRYQDRPSTWVEPEGDWGKGAVELVEIPTVNSVNDNMVAYWVPETQIKAGEPFSYAYRLASLLDDRLAPALGRVVATRAAPPDPTETAKVDRAGRQHFWVDFGEGDLPSLRAALPVEALLSASTGKIEEVVCRKVTGSIWRASFIFTPDGRKDSDLRAFLRLNDETLTETWSFLWAAE